MRKISIILIAIILATPLIAYAGLFDWLNPLIKPFLKQESRPAIQFVNNLGATTCFPYQGCTGISSYSRGDILLATTTSQLYKLATGTESQVLTITSGIPAWAASTGGVSAGWVQSNYYGTSTSDGKYLSTSTILTISFGGTGTSTAPADGYLLIGNSASKYSFIASSTLLENIPNNATTGTAISSLSGNLTLTRTDLIAGRSLTTSTAGQINVDAELFTKTLNFNMFNATSTGNKKDGMYFTVNALTIIEIGCFTDSGTSSAAFSERLGASPNASNTTILSHIVCDTDSASTTSFTDSAIAAGRWIGVSMTDTLNSTNTYIYIKETIDD